MATSYKSMGIVLKRKNYGETDRLVTIYSKDIGKITVLAKGVRKINSSRAGSLEPGTEARFYCLARKSLDLLLETVLIRTPQTKTLTQTTLIFQLLEIVDLLSAEYQENLLVYTILSETLAMIDHPPVSKAYLLEQIRLIIKAMGFTYDKTFTETKLKLYIEELAQKNLRSKSYLTT